MLIFSYTVFLKLTPPGSYFSMPAFVWEGVGGGGLFRRGSYSEGELFFNVVASFLTQRNSDHIVANKAFKRLKNMIRWCTRRQESPIRLRNFSRMRIH